MAGSAFKEDSAAHLKRWRAAKAGARLDVALRPHMSRARVCRGRECRPCVVLLLERRHRGQVGRMAVMRPGAGVATVEGLTGS